MHNNQLLALYGLKYNPFLPGIPVESLWSPPEMDSFLFRVENLVMEGGFALICGDPGLGKSKNLHLKGIQTTWNFEMEPGERRIMTGRII